MPIRPQVMRGLSRHLLNESDAICGAAARELERLEYAEAKTAVQQALAAQSRAAVLRQQQDEAIKVGAPRHRPPRTLFPPPREGATGGVSAT